MAKKATDREAHDQAMKCLAELEKLEALVWRWPGHRYDFVRIEMLTNILSEWVCSTFDRESGDGQ